MNLKEIVSISGMGGLHKVISQRPNGFIVESLADGNKKFITIQSNTATALENISIYDDEEGVDLDIVFTRMKELRGTKEPEAALKGSSKDLWAYMEEIVPTYDKDRVYASDVKKMIKWFLILEEKGLLEPEKEEKKPKATKAKDNAKEEVQSETVTESVEPTETPAKA